MTKPWRKLKMSELIHHYQNGNYRVKLWDDGTKIREGDYAGDGPLIPDFPENCDIKITNWCDNPICERYCHEQSNFKGEHGDLLRLFRLLRTAAPGMECAFGGGSTLSHPGLLELLRLLKNETELICNVTVNGYHLASQFELIEYMLNEKLIYGMGISFNAAAQREFPYNRLINLTGNMVYHLIAGIHTINDAKWICEARYKPKILVLGYKEFGNGVGYYAQHKNQVDANLYQWLTKIHTLIGYKDLILSFDNLAVEQLKIRRFFDEEGWNRFYQGDDGFTNLYVDAVKKEYAISSRSPNKHKLKDEDTFASIFEVVRKEKT